MEKTTKRRTFVALCCAINDIEASFAGDSDAKKRGYHEASDP